MKKRILGLGIMFFVFGSCCKKVQVIPTIKIEYSNLETGSYIIEKGHFSDDSSFVISETELNTTLKPITYRLGVYSSDVVFYTVTAYESVQDTGANSPLFLDTISKVSYELGGRCNQSIKNFSFVHNGELKTENLISK